MGNYSTVSWNCHAIEARMAKEKKLRDRIDKIYRLTPDLTPLLPRPLCYPKMRIYATLIRRTQDSARVCRKIQPPPPSTYGSQLQDQTALLLFGKQSGGNWQT